MIQTTHYELLLLLVVKVELRILLLMDVCERFASVRFVVGVWEGVIFVIAVLTTGTYLSLYSRIHLVCRLNTCQRYK